MLKMVVSDLDGTMLNVDKSIPQKVTEALNYLGQQNVIRVIATGRSPYSSHLVLPNDFPIDYLIFSSGAGIMDWHSKRIIHANNLSSETTQSLTKLLVANDVDFMIQDTIPNNHCFVYHSSGKENPDFNRRLEHYKGFNQELTAESEIHNSSQIVAIMPNNLELFDTLSAKIDGASVIRSTSPLDGDSIWMELFAEGVSKASGIDWLCQYLGNICPQQVATVGNDYNDVDMLEYTPNAFVVENSPNDLKLRFKVIPSNNDCGFAQLVSQIWGLNQFSGIG